MTESRCQDVNKTADTRYRTVRTNGLILATYDGVPVISLALRDKDAAVVSEQAIAALSRTFKVLTDGGTVRNSGADWLSKIHDPSLSQLPLARYPGGKRKAAMYTIERVLHLVPEQLTINCEPTIFGKFERLEAEDIEEEWVVPEEVSIAMRAIRAAREYPSTSVRLGLTQKKLLGASALPPNLEQVAARNGGDYIRISRSRAT